MVDSQEEAAGHITKDAVSLAKEDHDVTGLVQNDTFKLVDGDFSDADAVAGAWRCRPGDAASNSRQVPLREVANEVGEILSRQPLI